MREAEISEARGSHCRPLRRANSATRRRISSFAARALPKWAKASATAPPMLEPQRKSIGRPSSSITSSTPRWARPAAAPTLMATPTSRPQSRRTRWSSAGWRSRDQSLPEAPASISSRGERVRPALQGRRRRERPAPPDDRLGERVRQAGQVVFGDEQHVVGIEVAEQGRAARHAGAEQQHRVAVPFVAPAAHALGAAGRVVARHRRRAPSRARSGAGPGPMRPAGPGRPPRGAAAARRAAGSSARAACARAGACPGGSRRCGRRRSPAPSPRTGPGPRAPRPGHRDGRRRWPRPDRRSAPTARRSIAAPPAAPGGRRRRARSAPRPRSGRTARPKRCRRAG